MKTTAILKKVRRGDENIGKLIVFAVTIIIAVGVLGTLAYFYNQSRENATQMSILTSTMSTVDDLKTVGFCSSNTTKGYVKYDPVADMYGIKCDGGTVDQTKINSVRGILGNQTCSSNLTGDVDYCYKVNR